MIDRIGELLHAILAFPGWLLAALYRIFIVDAFLELRRYVAAIRSWRESPRAEGVSITEKLGTGVGTAASGIGGLIWGLLTAPAEFVRAFGRALRAVGMFFFLAPGYVWYHFGFSPLWRKLAIVGVLALAVGVGGFLWLKVRRDRVKVQEISAVDLAINQGRLSAAQSELERVLQGNPGDEAAARRLQALRNGTADTDDLPLLAALMADHLNGGRFKDAAREARKLLVTFPKSWPAHTVLAAEALSRRPGVWRRTADLLRNRREAAAHMADLPKTDKSVLGLSPALLLNTAGLCVDLDQNARLGEILSFLFREIAPHVHNTSQNLAPGEGLFLAELHIQALRRLAFDPAMVSHWLVCQQVCRGVSRAESVSPAQLLRLGQLQELQLTQILPEFAKRKLMPVTDMPGLTAGIEEHLEQIWGLLMKRDPKAVDGWLGEAARLARAGRVEAAVAVLDKGLAAVADAQARTVLATVKIRFLRSQSPAAGLDFAEHSLQVNPGSLTILQLTAESALAAGKSERALEICRKARVEHAEAVWARWMEGGICLSLNRPAEALAAWEPIRDRLSGHPESVHRYVQSLAAAGRLAAADEFLESLVRGKRPVVLVIAGAFGFAAAGRPADSLRWAERLAADRPEDFEVRKFLSETLLTAAESATGEWNRRLAERALAEYEWVRKRDPNNLVAVNSIVWLHLKALNSPDDAFRHSEPLRKVEDAAGLPPPVLDTLGVLYMARGRFEPARKLLQRAVVADATSAAYHCHLAEALLGLQKVELARATIDKAKTLTKTERERTEIASVLTRITKSAP